MVKILALASVASAQTLTNWESHGEVMDAEILAGPATNYALVGDQGNWIAGPNEKFEGMTLREAKSLMGTLQNTDPSTFLPFKAPERWVEDLPAEFDWREQDIAAKCPSIKEIRDQAACGSCWAFGTTEAMTDRICIGSQGADTTHLSTADVTSCCGLTHGDMGCNGGIPSTVYAYWKNAGVVDGGNYGDKSGCYSYQLPQCAHHVNASKYAPCEGSQPTPKCANKCIDTGADWKASKHYGADGGYSVCPQGDGTKCYDHMKQEIYQNGPITAQFFVHQSFESYQTGVYKSQGLKDPMLGGHAIKILGWGTEGGDDYWLVANSWNEDWAGLGGFFKLSRGTNEGQVENPIINGGPVAGLAKLNDITV
jgi:cathepsin B